ncbi:tetratricopeptide repeat protein [Roseibium aestuarii]|uniref:Tetratricopeptide repeat protein n=1 Tax=Roseibium aestuarii TaxID=2600299 RepID=A0ABW4JUR6_9HYPH|nr:tetratricopeptide repeat protein [Roseibium aestuarii]
MSAMRNAVTVTGMVLALATLAPTGPALAFDGEPRPTVSILPQPAGVPQEPSRQEALRNWLGQSKAGDASGALTSLQYAAEKGEPGAAWKLGKMYETGDGVTEDDRMAFQYYSQVIRQHESDRLDSRAAPYVASAYVALGNFFKTGIDGVVPRNTQFAEKLFRSAAFNFGDPQAQYELGLIYQQDRRLEAVRVFNLAALKGHVAAQARLGETLFDMAQSDDRRARGLMWLTVAQWQSRGVQDDWIGALHETYFARASEDIRRQALVMAEGWMQHNRPDLSDTLTVQAAQSIPAAPAQ